MSKLVFLVAIIVVVSARPNANIDTQNVVTVPPNCPSGQEWINGQCRDVWRQSQHDPTNVVVVPPNCPSGQQWIDEVCRDVWRQSQHDPKNVVVVPPNCPSGQQWINGACHDIWTQSQHDPKNVVVVPPNCLPGQEWINGQCRDVWRQGVDPKNTVTVPPNCPAGQEYINGQCRDVWIKLNKLVTDFEYNESKDRFEKMSEHLKLQSFLRSADEASGKDQVLYSIISVPNQCPTGQAADALGNCRPIWKN